MTWFSANLGFLFKTLPLADRVRAAQAAGFDAVEFHDEVQTTDCVALARALEDTGLPVCGLNIRMGETAGCAAIAGAEARFRRDLDAAQRAAATVDAPAIHILAGKTDAPDAAAVYRRNLRHALDATDRVILIEPICRAAMPGYFLHDLDQAQAIVDEIAHPRLRILFDCFHIEMEHGDCLARLRRHAGAIGHVQIASLPDRAEPDGGTLDLGQVLATLDAQGYGGAIGCEYRPQRADFDWLQRLRRRDGAAGVAPDRLKPSRA
ncbi:MAG: TIM barrel protein [Rhodobacterales bacterium]|nr:TIM barrel protein [Rhodobacterales bacterium]NCT13468.1 TIM barrel protein [Rhodobacterales bacterium]